MLVMLMSASAPKKVQLKPHPSLPRPRSKAWDVQDDALRGKARSGRMLSIISFVLIIAIFGKLGSCFGRSPTVPESSERLRGRRSILFSISSLSLNAINSGAAAATSPFIESSTGSSSASDSAVLRKELFNELRGLKQAGGTWPSSSHVCEEILDKLVLLNPTNQPGAFPGFGPLAAGRWRVAHAPHIAKLSALVGAVFDPILYDLESPDSSRGGGPIQSHVRYSLFGGQFRGWLSTDGDYGTEDGNTVSRVDWKEAWWDATSSEVWSKNPEESTLAPFVSALGKLGFVSGFAKFPVQYLDDDLCIFVFPLSGTRILAIRAGSSMDIWQ
eukprot:TRINITY_DN805_c0_g2_i1.p1 TRINITY_DN805_c0_g2~~TRINITY_DN805_c0_g2_i1.p1  ORF type:complete len:329 (+),score=24.71 TRINITY_DN805_c0_g2_i1:50-1036(+)